MKHLFKQIIIAILLSAALQTLYAQRRTISGTIRDHKNGEVLIGANVMVKSLSVGVATNMYGFYSLSLDPGKYTLQYTYVGYVTYEKEIDLATNVTFNIEIEEESQEIKEVVILSKKKNDNIESVKMSNMALSSKVIGKIPAMMGEVDVIKALTLMPGVKQTGESSSGLSIRGGTRDQNLILLDEATVYNASHLGGMFSVFNNDAIKSVEVYKGNIPAQYGGRLSSLIDIRMKDGNNKKVSGSGGIGTISSRLTLEAPIVKDKSSIMISGRRTYIDAIMKLLHKMNDTIPELPYNFYDLNIKANYTINDKHRIYVSGYMGRDAFKMNASNDTKSTMSWGNYTTTFRWNYTINSKLFANFTLLSSEYSYNVNNQFTFGEKNKKKKVNFEWDANLRDYSAKADFGWYVDPNNTVKFGVQSIYHEFNTAEVKGNFDTMKFDYKIPVYYASENAAFISNEQKIGDLLSLGYGIRLSTNSNIGKSTIYKYNNYEVNDTIKYGNGNFFKTYIGLEPRLAARVKITDNSSVKASYSRTRQYLQIASNSVSGTPLDIWIPSGPNIKPQLADQYSIGYFHNFFDDQLRTSVEIYYKDMYNQIDFKEFAQPYLNEQIEGLLRFGEGRAYGAEFFIEKPEGDFTGWISYTYSHSERKINDIQEKDWFNSPYDIPHDLSIVAMYQVAPRLSVSANWVYRTGLPFVAPSQRWEYGNIIIPQFTKRNNDRMPDYHRLDVGIEYKNKPKTYYQSSWTLSVYNAYNQRNSNSIYFIQDEENPQKTKAMSIAMFKIIPTITWNFKF